MINFADFLPECYAAVTLFGLIMGSFLTVIVVRYPEILKRQWRAECSEFLQLAPPTAANPLSLSRPRSHCPHCHTPLAWYHNLPLLGYLLQRGRCKHCQRRISWLYPCLELSTVIISLLLFWRFGPTTSFLASLVFAYALIALIAIDWSHQILPDVITLSTLWLGLLVNSTWLFISLDNAVWSAAFGYSFLWLISWLFLKIRQKQGMGHGDFKMLAMIGAWLGGLAAVNVLLFAVLLGCVISLLLLVTKRTDWRRPIPFGPFLGIAALLTLIVGPFMVRWFWMPLT